MRLSGGRAAPLGACWAAGKEGCFSSASMAGQGPSHSLSHTGSRRSTGALQEATPCPLSLSSLLASKAQKRPNGSHVQAQATGPGHIPGAERILRLFWTGGSVLPGNLCRLFALVSWWLIFHSAGLIWICAAVGVGRHKAGALEDNSRMAHLPPHGQAGWPRHTPLPGGLHTASITPQLPLSLLTGF